MKAKKNTGGRPVVGNETKKRYQVMLEPTVAAKLRAAGRENLSAGIALAAKQLTVAHFS